jgi:hypothetical protein
VLSESIGKHIPDRVLLREQAQIALGDAYYLGAEVIGLSRDEFPAPPQEAKPFYDFLDRPRPALLSPRQIWLDFWASPRFTRKTYTVAVWLTQQIIREPNIRIIVDGQERQAAGDTVKLIREWLMLPEIVRLFGQFDSDDWGKFEFTVSQRTKALRDPTMRALGLDNSEQGKRCDIRWWDDLIGKSNNNPEGIAKVEQHISAGMPIIKPGGRGLYTCTRWNALDPSTDGFTVSGNMGILRHFKQGTGSWHAPPPRGWFSAYAQPGDELFYPHAKPGELLYPSVLSEDFLEAQRRTMSHSEFSSQYLNNPLANEDRPFHEEDIQYFDPVDENGVRNECLTGAIPYLSVDPASGKLKTATKDDTTLCVAYIKWQENFFHVYVVEWLGGRWQTDRIYNQILSLNDAYKVRRMYLEANVGREFFINPLRKAAQDKGIFLPIEDFSQSLHGTGKKDQRIEQTLQPLYAQRRVWHARHLKNTKAEDQLLRWVPGGAGHDDYPDVLATLVFFATQKRHAAVVTGRPAKIFGLGAPVRYRSTGV